MIYLSIIIPAFNEEYRISNTINETIKFIIDRNYRCEIIVVDDGSTDRTSDMVQEFVTKNNVNLKLIRNEVNNGKGNAVKKGILSAQGEIVIFYDADLSVPTSEILRVINPIEEGRYDIVIGSRNNESREIKTEKPILRRIIGRLGAILIRRVTGLNLGDLQCGFKVFRRSVAQSLFSQQTINGWGFDSEILFIAVKSKLKVLEMPVICRHIDGSKVHLITTSYHVLKDIITIRWNSMVGAYNYKNVSSASQSFADKVSTRAYNEQ